MPERLSTETGPAAPGEPGTAREEMPRRRLLVQVAAFLGACLGIGAVAGFLWSRLVELPGYVVDAQGRATTTERGLTEYFSGDAWFCLLGLVGGLLIGALAWWRLVRVGWPVVLLAIAGSLLAGGLTWLVGTWVGPGDFEIRLSEAGPGDVVPIELTLRAPVALVVWPFVASLPILLWSSLAPDHEEATPLFGQRTERARRRHRHQVVAGVLPEYDPTDDTLGRTDRP